MSLINTLQNLVNGTSFPHPPPWQRVILFFPSLLATAPCAWQCSKGLWDILSFTQLHRILHPVRSICELHALVRNCRWHSFCFCKFIHLAQLWNPMHFSLLRKQFHCEDRNPEVTDSLEPLSTEHHYNTRIKNMQTL